MFLVETNVDAANVVEVVIDSDSSVSIDRCVELSRLINDAFNRDDEDFELTVSSAGVGRPVKMLRQYLKLKGKAVEVVLRSGEKIEGTLADACEGSITLEYVEKRAVEGSKRKQLFEVSRKIDMVDIKSTVQQIKF